MSSEKIYDNFRNSIAVLNFVLLQFYFFRKASFTFPSLTFNYFPFAIHKGGSLTIGRKAIINKQTEILSKGILKIGNNFTLNKFSRVVAHENISIGDNVTIAQFVAILDHDHKYTMVDGNMLLGGYITKPITIGNNVWIGDKVTICKGVTIGNNVIIGANSVVTKDIESNSIAAGNPCVKIKQI
jgi:maltose O-acetyltransferase